MFTSFLSFAQHSLTGTVQDKKGNPVFAANVYLKSTPEKGATTDFEGKFSLTLDNINDILVISYLGFQTQEILLTSIDFNKPLVILLKENAQSLEEVIITARDPISEQFSVVKMSMLKDVYLNPVAQGDPLKAITILPASTTTDETANPSLRGSSPNRSRVMLNGVPIYNPVRATSLSNMGFFSLFNPEIIDRQYVYASNPPLTYGNTSAGLVEIQTKKDLNVNQLQLSAGLASLGVFLSQNIKKDTSFIQAYGNYQFSDGYIGIQKNKLPNLKNFNILDAGVNFHTKTGKQSEFNSYNYFIDESYNGVSQSFTYKGDIASEKKRFFTVNSFKYYSEKGVLSINNGVDYSKQSFEFGNLNSKQKTNQVYASIDYKKPLSENLDLQAGVSYDYQSQNFKDSIPTYYYAQSPSSPNFYSETSVDNTILEAYLYGNWEVNDKITLSSGIRSNIPIEEQDYYLSSQLGLKYNINNKHSFLLSGGKYHSYATPNYFSKTYNLLSSYQAALDYTYKLENTLLKAATYYKEETGNQTSDNFFTTEKVNTYGIEFYVEHNFLKYFNFSFSNSFIDQKRTISTQKYHGSKDFNYLIKSAIQYSNPKLFTLALTYFGLPGTFYNDIVGSEFDSQTNFYIPTFSNELYNAQYSNYNRVDISWSKYIRLKKNALISYVSVNNIFNSKNEREALYNTDYSSKYFDYYQLRTIYFGLVWQFDY
ncbi:MAG: carboxypeptidase-like regulatory domain-containing protein [Urechidicola sp.]|nr:carboxypeptidase-like regulatory domain-containing protein [Urechidicola sp.]